MAPSIPIPRYVLASLAVSLGGFLNGYDSGAIGGITTMKQFSSSVGVLSPSLLGFTVSLIMLTGAFPAPFAGHLADRYGRLKVIALGAALFAIGTTLQGAAYALPQFLVGRAIAGFGEGVYLPMMAVYICEICPLKARGTLAGLPQFMATLGTCTGYFTCYGTVNVHSSMAWRLPYVVQSAIAVVLAVCCITSILPDSPRWLMMHGKQPEALHAVQKLHYSLVEAERDILGTNAGEQRPSLSAWQSFMLLFRRGYRARTILALFILGMVQLSGIDAIIYYAPILFAQAGISSDTASFLASGLSAILMFAVSIPAFLLTDKWGRRTSAITGGLALSGIMFLMGFLYAAGAVHPYGVARWVVIISVFVFSLTYCSTWGIVGKIYAGEIQPSNTRATANSVAQGLGFITNWLVAILTPILLDKSAFGAYFLFGGLALGTVAVLAAYMPETRGRSLESIQEAFQQPRTVKGLNHYLGKLLPKSGHQLRQRRAQQSSGVEMVPQNASSEGPSTSAPSAVASSLRLDLSTA